MASAAMTVAGCLLSGVRFAVPLHDVQQLMTFPSGLIRLPRREGALVGAFTLQGDAIPVVDLRRWLPWPGESTSDPGTPDQILVLRQGVRRLAVGIDRVDGLHRVGAGAAQPLAHGDAGDEVFASVVNLTGACASGGAAASALGLLDVTALMRLGRLWGRALDGETPLQPAAHRGAGEPKVAATALKACALLESEGEWLAIPASQLRSVLPMPAVQPLWSGDPNQLGVVRWRERDVPVLRLLPSLGLGTDTLGPAPLLAVVEHDGLCLGVPVQAVRDVVVLDLAGARPPQALGMAPHPALLGELSCPDGRKALLIDVQALVTMHPLAALSSEAVQAKTEARQSTQEVQAVQAHVVVQAGSTLALPILALLAVIELPEAWAASPDGVTPRRLTWREFTVPVWDLRARMGHGASQLGPAAKVLILQSGDHPFGLLVEALLHLLPARHLESRHVPIPGGRVLPFVVHRDGPEQRSFALLDLQEFQEERAG